jgi:hypothetical protein
MLYCTAWFAEGCFGVADGTAVEAHSLLYCVKQLLL